MKFLKNDEGLSRDKITCYDHLMSYMFWYYKYKHANDFLQFFSSFLKIFVIYEFFQLQGPGIVLWGLIMERYIVYSEMDFNILMFSTFLGLEIWHFLMKSAIFFNVRQSLCQFLIFVHS